MHENKQLKLSDFRIQLGTTLCQLESSKWGKREWLSNNDVERMLTAKKS
jgi:hypothetical protein